MFLLYSFYEKTLKLNARLSDRLVFVMVGPLFASACLLANVPLKGFVSRDCGVCQLQHRCNVQKKLTQHLLTATEEHSACPRVDPFKEANVMSRANGRETENVRKEIFTKQEQQFHSTCESKRTGIKWVKRLNTFRFQIKLKAEKPPG